MAAAAKVARTLLRFIQGPPITTLAANCAPLGGKRDETAGNRQGRHFGARGRPSTVWQISWVKIDEFAPLSPFRS
jgi:hypothetical protein